MSGKPRAADDFETIRERREQLRREREAAEKAKAEQGDAEQQSNDQAPCGFVPLRETRAMLAIKAIKLRQLRLLRVRA